MTYEIEFSAKASKELQKLPHQARKQVAQAINKLAANPRKGSVRPMVGVSSWRLRSGDYRVVYDIHDHRLLVLVIKIGHRRDVYKA